MAAFAFGVRQRLLQTVCQQHAIGYARQRIVVRDMLQLFFVLLEQGDIGERTNHAQRSSGNVAAYDCTPAEYPFPAAVLACQPHLRDIVSGIPPEIVLQFFPDPVRVIGMDDLEKVLCIFPEFAVLISEYLGKTSGIVKLPRFRLPVPHRIAGTFQRMAPALFCQAHHFLLAFARGLGFLECLVIVEYKKQGDQVQAGGEYIDEGIAGIEIRQYMNSHDGQQDDAQPDASCIGPFQEERACQQQEKERQSHRVVGRHYIDGQEQAE